MKYEIPEMQIDIFDEDIDTSSDPLYKSGVGNDEGIEFENI